MSHEQIQQRLLDGDWTEQKLREADELLRDVEADPAALTALREYDQLRSTVQLSDDDIPEPSGGWLDREAAGGGHSAPTIGRIQWHWLGAMAACLAFAVVGWTLHLNESGAQPSAHVAVHGGGSDEAGPTRHKIQPSESEIREQVTVYQEVAQVFEGKANWVAVADKGSDVGVANEVPAMGERLLLLRLVMTRDHRTVSQADLIIVPGQDANLTLPFEDGQTLRYTIGTGTQSPRRLSIWAQVDRPSGAETLAAVATTLHPSPGQTLEAGRLVTSAGQYKLDIAFSEASMNPNANGHSAGH